MHHVLLLLPMLLPLLTAIACMVTGSVGRQRWLGLVGATLNVAATAWLVAEVHRHGILATRLGDWPAPFGIAFAADRLGAAMALAAASVGLLGTAYAIPTLARPALLLRFLPLLNLMMAGMGGFFLTADLFNFYVWFELVLVSSFGLMVLNGDRSEVEGTLKYFAMNAVGSLLLLTGIGLLYALTGTLDFADLAQRLDASERPALLTTIAALMLVALGVKSAAFPLFFWLPASYHAPPIAVTAIFGGVLTKVGVYGLLRLFTLLFVQETNLTHGIILVVGGLTMVTGVLGAVAQHDMRRLLSFHIISQIGYMLMGLGLYTVAGLAAALFFVLHIIVVKTALFFVSGVAQRLRGSFELERMGGLYAERPALAVLFLLPALSLGGIPPLSGFVGKLALVQAGLETEQYVIVAVSLVVSLLTLYSMVKIWTLAFWAPRTEKNERPREVHVPGLLWGPLAVLGTMAVVMGLAAGPLLDYSTDAAHQLMDRRAYIDAVLATGGR